MDELIYNQRQIPKEQWRYGVRSSAATGCGWIATHNALRLMGYPSEPEDLIRGYTRQLPLIHGLAGTSLFGLYRFFQKRGFGADLVLRKKKFDQATRQADVAILFYRWRNKWAVGAHFVTVHDTEDEGFVGYNTYRTSTGPDRYGTSLAGFLKRRKYYGAILLTIQNPGGVPPRKAVAPTPAPMEPEPASTETPLPTDAETATSAAEQTPEQKDTAVT